MQEKLERLRTEVAKGRLQIAAKQNNLLKIHAMAETLQKKLDGLKLQTQVLEWEIEIFGTSS
jgi:hypothetical protein